MKIIYKQVIISTIIAIIFHIYFQINPFFSGFAINRSLFEELVILLVILFVAGIISEIFHKQKKKEIIVIIFMWPFLSILVLSIIVLMTGSSGIGIINAMNIVFFGVPSSIAYLSGIMIIKIFWNKE